jgi:hypothetical protein
MLFPDMLCPDMLSPATRPLAALLALPLLIGCKRDPVLLGYWDILSLEVGPAGGEADLIDDVGTIEFHKDSKAYVMLRCAWEGGALVPTPPTGPWEVPTDSGPQSDFIEAYATDGEEFTVLLGAYTYDIVDWTVNHVTLRSESAAPPPEWGTVGTDTAAGGGYTVAWELSR